MLFRSCDGSAHAPRATPGRVIGPSFAATEVVDAVEAILEVYRNQRAANEKFVDTVQRLGLEPFKAAANAARHPAVDAQTA